MEHTFKIGDAFRTKGKDSKHLYIVTRVDSDRTLRGTTVDNSYDSSWVSVDEVIPVAIRPQVLTIQEGKSSKRRNVFKEVQKLNNLKNKLTGFEKIEQYL